MNLRDRLILGSPLFKAMVSRLDATTALVNELKVDFNAHRVLTAGSVHGAADTANAVTSANVPSLDLTE